MKKKSAVYLHVPFCESKCFYCSFYVFVNQKHKVKAYLKALIKDIPQYKATEVSTIYIGGGTPTIFSEEQLENLLECVTRHFRINDDVEFTFEANPEHVTESKIFLLRKYGVNRLSLGIQSLNNQYLKFLGRSHNAITARKAFHVARESGFKNISCDLIYGFPGQTMSHLKKDVQGILQLQGEHLSLYSLNIEDNSLFKVKNVKLPSHEYQVKQYLAIVKMVQDAGYRQYEISNFAKKGKESKHNVNYWQGGNYIGLGAGAHSHNNGKRSWNVFRINEYIQRISFGKSVEEGHEVLNKEQRLVEALLFGLRMNKGVSLQELEIRFGKVLDQKRRSLLEEFINKGLFIKKGKRIQATQEGMLLLDEISAYLV